eukprot:Em0010g608a
MADSRLLPPQPFDFRKPDERPRWLRRFSEQYRVASDLVFRQRTKGSRPALETKQFWLQREIKVADHVQEDTSTHLDGEIKEDGANNVESVGEGPSNSEHQDSVDEGPSDGVDEGPSGGVNDSVNEGPSDGVDEGPSDGVDERPSDGVDEGSSDGVDEGPCDGVDEGPCDGVDERPSDEGPSDVQSITKALLTAEHFLFCEEAEKC